jgi:hypothetical protein
LAICFDKCDQIPGTSNGKTIYVFDANRRKIHKSLENAFDVEIDAVDNPFRLGILFVLYYFVFLFFHQNITNEIMRILKDNKNTFL